MRKVGITGNIGSGKSEVEKILTRLGYKVLCADEITHWLFENDKEVQDAIMAQFSTLDRKKIGRVIFSDSHQKEALEKIMHPKIVKKIKDFFEQNLNEDIIFVSAALIYEIRIENLFDGIILVVSDEKNRLERIMARDNCTAELAKLRMNAQILQDEKIKYQNFIIENNSNLISLEKRVKEAVDFFR